MPDRYERVLEKEKRWKQRLYKWIPSYRFSNDIYEDAIKERLREGICWVDLGCGRNELMDELRDFGANSFGLDCLIHPQLILKPHQRFIQAEVAYIPCADNSIDVISSNTLMEHLADPASALIEIKRCLKPGGVLIIRTPNAHHILNLLFRLVPEVLKKWLILNVLGVPSEDVFPTFYRANRWKDISRLCRDAGFDNFKITAVEDVHTAFAFFFLLSLLYYSLVRMKALFFLRTNFVLIAKK